MLLLIGMEVGLGPGDIVLDVGSSFPNGKEHSSPSPHFRVLQTLAGKPASV